LDELTAYNHETLSEQGWKLIQNELKNLYKITNAQLGALRFLTKDPH